MFMNFYFYYLILICNSFETYELYEVVTLTLLFYFKSYQWMTLNLANFKVKRNRVPEIDTRLKTK